MNPQKAITYHAIRQAVLRSCPSCQPSFLRLLWPLNASVCFLSSRLHSQSHKRGAMNNDPNTFPTRKQTITNISFSTLHLLSSNIRMSNNRLQTSSRPARSLKRGVGDMKMKREEYVLPVGEVVIITDDAIAKRIITALGLLDKLQSLLNHVTTTANWITSENHSTHWVLAGHYRGFEKPEDNGFCLKCYPKTDFTFEQVQSQLRSSMGSSCFEFNKHPQQPLAN